MERLMGRPLAREDEADILRMRESDGSIHLVCIYDPSEEDSAAYLKQILTVARRLQTEVEVLEVSDDRSARAAEKRIQEASGRDSLIVLRPLRFLDERAVENLDPRRDPDCFSAGNRAAIYGWTGGGFIPATARSVMRLISSTGIEVKGKRALVIGRSLSVGLPVFNALMRANAMVTLCHSRVSVETIREEARRSYIVVLASGHRGLVTPECLRDGQVIIDCGYHADDRGGDLGFVPDESLEGFYTPVPGGVGPLTVVSLIHNAYAMLEGVR